MALKWINNDGQGAIISAGNWILVNIVTQLGFRPCENFFFFQLVRVIINSLQINNYKMESFFCNVCTSNYFFIFF